MLVVIAQPEELKLVKELGYEKYPVIITGVGAINIINSLRDIPFDTEILNIGYCGSNKVKVGTKVWIDQVHTLHEKASFSEPIMYANGIHKIGEMCLDCYTATDFVTSTKIKEPCVFDMELAFIRALYPNTRAIKVVSDNLNKKQYKESVK